MSERDHEMDLGTESGSCQASLKKYSQDLDGLLYPVFCFDCRLVK